MNHAFIIQVHNYPEQLKEIIDLLHAENHYFFINVDKKVDDHPFKEALKGYSNIFSHLEKKEPTSTMPDFHKFGVH